MLPVGDQTPPDFALATTGVVERFIKRPLRRFIYPAYNEFVTRWLATKYAAQCEFSVDRWLWGQRGNDYETHRRRVNRFASLVGRHLLIAGCGTGRDIVSWLPYRPSAVTGIDYFRYDRAWSVLCEAAKRDYPATSLEFIQGDLGQTDQFADETFDLIGSDAVLEHVRDLPGVLAAFYRVLRPGGLVYANFGPLWYCWGGDHLSGYDCIASGYNHLLLKDVEYASYLDAMGPYTHSQHDGRTWVYNDLFSRLRPAEYLGAFDKQGFGRLFVAAVIDPRAVQCLTENPVMGAALRQQYGEINLIVSGLTIIYQKPVRNT